MSLTEAWVTLHWDMDMTRLRSQEIYLLDLNFILSRSSWTRAKKQEVIFVLQKLFLDVIYLPQSRIFYWEVYYWIECSRSSRGNYHELFYMGLHLHLYRTSVHGSMFTDKWFRFFTRRNWSIYNPAQYEYAWRIYRWDIEKSIAVLKNKS